MAFKQELDVTKLSFQAFGHLVDDYMLLRSGSALGRGCGPLLVAKEFKEADEFAGKKVAIPGKFTTAAMLLRLYNPEFKDLVEMTFDQIMPAVNQGLVDAGLIIHEGRFTFEKENLVNIIDLGEWWEKTTGLPIPLGGIFARRALGLDTVAAVNDCVRESIDYAFRHREEPLDYVKEHAQELDDNVIKQHLDLYVNSFSVDLGAEGVAAVRHLLRLGHEKGLFADYREDFILP
jgi:1,4-dihydroxy-6-naphthoate synthase